MDPDREDSRSDFYETPNLEKLAQRGMTFSQAYAAAPKCAPSRMSVLTGQSTARHQITNTSTATSTTDLVKSIVSTKSIPVGEETIANWLSDYNPAYKSAHFGKWHLGNGGPFIGGGFGFDEGDGDTANGTGDNCASNFGTSECSDPKLIFTLADRGEDFIRRKNTAGEPFYLQLSHYAVHGGVEYTTDSKTKYDATALGKIHEDIEYAAMTEDFDKSVGQIMDLLDELGIADETYIIFTSDNGAGGLSDNSPLFEGKNSLAEGGIRVPMIVTGPGIPANSHSDFPVVGYDLAPTILALAGETTMPTGIDGVSFDQLLLVGTAPTRTEPLIFHFPHYVNNQYSMSSALIDGQYKLIANYAERHDPNEAFKLFELTGDIGEQTDISAAYPQKTLYYQKRLRDYLIGVNALLPTLEDGTNSTDKDQDGWDDNWEMENLLTFAYNPTDHGTLNLDNAGPDLATEGTLLSDPFIDFSGPFDATVTLEVDRLALANTALSYDNMGQGYSVHYEVFEIGNNTAVIQGSELISVVTGQFPIAGLDAFFSPISEGLVFEYTVEDQNGVISDPMSQTIKLNPVLAGSCISFTRADSSWLSASSWTDYDDILDQGEGNFTIEAWVYLNQIPASSNSEDEQGFISRWRRNNRDGWALYPEENGKIIFALGNNENIAYQVESEVISTNKWYHVAAVREGDALYLSLNGLPQDTVIDSGIDAFSLSSAATMVFGRRVSTVDARYLDGKIDEIRIWNGARSLPQLQRYMLEPLDPVGKRGLLLYLNFDEGTGTTAYDQSSTGCDYTVTNATFEDASARQPNFNVTNGNWQQGATWSYASTPASGEFLYIDGAVRVRGSSTYQFEGIHIAEGSNFTRRQNATAIISAGYGYYKAGNVTPATYDYLTIDDANSMNMIGEVVVNKGLNLVNGHLMLNGHELILGESASFYGANELHYVVTEDHEAATGLLKRTVAAGTTAPFPIGTLDAYTPITLENTGAQSNTFEVRVFNGLYTLGTSGVEMTETDEAVNKSYVVHASPLAPSANVTFQWNQADQNVGFDGAAMFISQNDGTGWSTSSSYAPANGNNPFDATISITSGGTFNPQSGSVSTSRHGNLLDSALPSKVLKVWPNPTTGMLTLWIDDPIEAANSRIQVTDGIGRIIRQVSLEAFPSQLDLSSLTPGLYHVTLFENGEVKAFKQILKQ